MISQMMFTGAPVSANIFTGLSSTLTSVRRVYRVVWDGFTLFVYREDVVVLVIVGVLPIFDGVDVLAWLDLRWSVGCCLRVCVGMLLLVIVLHVIHFSASSASIKPWLLPRSQYSSRGGGAPPRHFLP